jgi:hypothetical protein
MAANMKCPNCGSSDLLFSRKQQVYICEDCHLRFQPEKKFTTMRIFISYDHDEHAQLAQRLKADLEARGHEVWFDLDRLRPGGDWEAYIHEGLEWVAEVPGAGRVVLLMTPHSIRRPDGYCLNEIARAVERGLPVVPVMVVWAEPPLSICRVQWLDMQECVPIQDRQERYETKFERFAEAVEQDQQALAISEELRRCAPSSAEHARDLVVSYYKLAGLHDQTGDRTLAGEFLGRCHSEPRRMRVANMHLDPALARLLNQLDAARGK